MRRALALAAGALLIGVASAHALRVPAAPRCPVFPASNVWNRRVDRLPVAAKTEPLTRELHRKRRCASRTAIGKSNVDHAARHGRVIASWASVP